MAVPLNSTDETQPQRAHDQCQYGYVSSRLDTIIDAPSSSALDLTRSNDPPLHSVALDLKHRLQEIDSLIADADRDVARMKADIDILVKRREELAAYRKTYRTVLHPVRSLPPEVLLEIFLGCIYTLNVKTSEHSHEPLSLSTTHAPWLLAYVCRRWRGIVFSSPKLWSTISIDLARLDSGSMGSMDSRRQSNLISLMSHYLRYSRDHPLTVAISSPTASHPILPMLFSHSSRWERAYLHLTVAGFETLSSIVKGSLPLLRYVHLRAQPSSASRLAWEAVVIDAFQHAPKLKSVKVIGIPAFAQHVQLPWSQVRACEYYKRAISTGPDSSDALGVIREGVNLKVCTLKLVEHLSLNPISFVRHDTLQSLNLKCRSMQIIGQVLDMLTGPALMTLHIYVVGDCIEQDDDGQAIVHFIERCSCSLTTLVINGWRGMTDILAVRLLHAIPTIWNLSIGGVTNVMLRELVFTEGSPCLLPDLTCLTLFGKGQQPLDELLLLEMLKSRTISDDDEEISADGPCTLSLVKLSPEFEFNSAEARERLAELRSVMGSSRVITNFQVQ